LKLNSGICIVYRDKSYGKNSKWEIVKVKGKKGIKELFGCGIEIFGIYKDGKKQ